MLITARFPLRAIRALHAGACVCLALASGCGEPDPAAMPPLPIQVVQFSSSPTAPFIEYVGTIAEPAERELAFGVQGRLVEILVVPGQRVEKGAVLARLDAAPFRASLTAERAELAASRAGYERQRAEREGGGGSEQDVERARRGVEAFEARVRAIEKAIEESELRAPFRGKVVQLLQSAPADIGMKKPVLSLLAEDALRVDVVVPLQSLSLREITRSLDELDEVIDPVVIANSHPHSPFPADLTGFVVTGDEETRDSVASFHFAVPKAVTVAAGTRARVRAKAPVGEVGTGSLTAAALAPGEAGSYFVWVVDPDSRVAGRRVVRVKRSNDGPGVRVIAGLRDGEWVAVSAVDELSEGRRVEWLDGPHDAPGSPVER